MPATTNSRYQVNAHDDDTHSEGIPEPKPRYPTPNSPPPSFHSRNSSTTRRNDVNPDLADAFDDYDASDDETDDRQRLVRRNSTPSSGSTGVATPQTSITEGQATAPIDVAGSGSRRVMGGGNGRDGVFANMSARPERVQETEKDEQPPVG